MNRTQKLEMVKAFRLAIRHEGDKANAYFCRLDTMQNAIFIGSIHIAAVKEDPEVLDAWKDVMKKSVQAVVRAMLGVDVQFDASVEFPASTHKAGNA